MIILSIDSGLEKTGYAICDLNKKYDQGFKYITSDLISTSKKDLKELRINEIYSKLNKIVNKFKPQLIILEELFFFKNLKTAITVAQAQGVILLLAAQNTIPINFLPPLQIKQVITGYGYSDKKSVRKMIDLTLKINKKIKEDDEIDAIACGLAYCFLSRRD